jgi:hypothetical protein
LRLFFTSRSRKAFPRCSVYSTVTDQKIIWKVASQETSGSDSLNMTNTSGATTQARINARPEDSQKHT